MHVVGKIIDLVEGLYLLRGLFLIVPCKASIQGSSAKVVYLFGIIREKVVPVEQRTLFLPVLAVPTEHFAANNLAKVCYKNALQNAT